MTHEEIEQIIKHHEAKALNRKQAGRAGAEIYELTAAVLRHLLQAQRWRPIEEAPKDGNAFLAYGRHTHSPKDAQRGVKAGDHWWAIILWDIWRPEEDGGRAWVFAKDGQYTWSKPTHWMTLPEPPSSFEEPTTPND